MKNQITTQQSGSHGCAVPVTGQASGDSPRPHASGKLLLLAFSLLLSLFAMSQAPGHRYICQMTSAAGGLSQNQIDNYLSTVNLENYRLQNGRDTLAFDNGFTIILYSATELQRAGQLQNAASYTAALPDGYVLPVFHINQAGQVTAEYPIVKSKYSTR